VLLARLALGLLLALALLLAQRAEAVRVGELRAVAVAGEVFVLVVGGGGAHACMVAYFAADVNPSERNFCSGAPES